MEYNKEIKGTKLMVKLNRKKIKTFKEYIVNKT